MDPSHRPVGWFDVEVNQDRNPRRAQQPQQQPPRQGLNLVPTHEPPVLNMEAVFRQQQYLEQQKREFLQQQQQQGMEVEVNTEPANPLQDYLENLVLRVEGRGSSSGCGGPLYSQELAELTLHASRRSAVAFAKIDADTMTTVAQWLYEDVLHATSLSIVNEAGRVFAKDAAPSQAMAALQIVSDVSVIS